MSGAARRPNGSRTSCWRFIPGWRLVGLADAYAFTLPFTQEMMSDALGLSVPHLNRTLGKLRAERLIAVNERHVAFIDLKALQMLAQFQPAEPVRIPLRAKRSRSTECVALSGAGTSRQCRSAPA